MIPYKVLVQWNKVYTARAINSQLTRRSLLLTRDFLGKTIVILLQTDIDFKLGDV